MKYIPITALLIAILALGAVSVSKGVFGSSSSYSRDGFQTVTTRIVSIASTTTATTTNGGLNGLRQYLYMKNVGPNAVTCDATSTITTDKGWVLSAAGGANSVLSFDNMAVFKGQVWCVANTATSSIAVVEN